MNGLHLATANANQTSLANDFYSIQSVILSKVWNQLLEKIACTGAFAQCKETLKCSISVNESRPLMYNIMYAISKVCELR